MTAERPVYAFDAALLREPSATVSAGLSAQVVTPPSYEAVCQEHRRYVEALRQAGVETFVLPALDDFPDAVFVEDPALVFGDTAIVLRPGAPSRQGEAQAMAPSLKEHFFSVLHLPGNGHAEGGDVLVAADEVMIGLSDRTDQAGAEALVTCLETLGLSARIVQTPPDVLHFKSDCSVLDERTVLTTERLARSGVFDGYATVVVPDDELAAANALRVNDTVLVGDGFPATAAMLREAGYQTVALPTTAIGKLDAGLSCMSLRWRQPR
ncbi:MAG: arginine deiminase family protein [Pseudomonadota bacterium]